jgi:hypothetical protein
MCVSLDSLARPLCHVIHGGCVGNHPIRSLTLLVSHMKSDIVQHFCYSILALVCSKPGMPSSVLGKSNACFTPVPQLRVNRLFNMDSLQQLCAVYMCLYVNGDYRNCFTWRVSLEV